MKEKGGTMTDTIRPRRSVLYVPGTSPRAQEKARGLPADSIVIDLEDSVAPDGKSAARDLVASTVKSGGFGPREVGIRINPPDTEWYEADLAAAAQSGADAILVTKIQSPEDVLSAEERLRSLGAAPGVALWVMIETPRALLEIREIARTARRPESRLKGLVLGTNDILKETGARPARDRAPLLPWLAVTLMAARAEKLFVLDGVFNDFSDENGLLAECEQGRDFGFDGKTLIHPSQIATANRVFSPTQAEVGEAERILEAFERPENRGKGAIAMDGRMVERLHADIAARTIAVARAIAARESGS
jgi:citrate lyase subunit beta/citryl-CoA lyase